MKRISKRANLHASCITFKTSDKHLDWKVCSVGVDKIYTNQELLLWKQGTIIIKSWELENTGLNTWPKNTAICVEAPNVECKIPKIKRYVDPKVRVRITIVIKIKEENLERYKDGSDIIEYKFSLYTPSDGRFGDSLRLYWQYDEKEFDNAWNAMTPTGFENEKAPMLDRSRIFIES